MIYIALNSNISCERRSMLVIEKSAYVQQDVQPRVIQNFPQTHLSTYSRHKVSSYVDSNKLTFSTQKFVTLHVEINMDSFLAHRVCSIVSVDSLAELVCRRCKQNCIFSLVDTRWSYQIINFCSKASLECLDCLVFRATKKLELNGYQRTENQLKTSFKL